MVEIFHWMHFESCTVIISFLSHSLCLYTDCSRISAGLFDSQRLIRKSGESSKLALCRDRQRATSWLLQRDDSLLWILDGVTGSPFWWLFRLYLTPHNMYIPSCQEVQLCPDHGTELLYFRNMHSKISMLQTWYSQYAQYVCQQGEDPDAVPKNLKNVGLVLLLEQQIYITWPLFQCKLLWHS